MVATGPPIPSRCARRPLAALAIALAATSAGCASPLSSGLADSETNRLVEAAAADDSIPSAAEVGLEDDESDATGDATPESSTSSDAASSDAASSDATSNDATPGDASPDDAPSGAAR